MQINTKFDIGQTVWALVQGCPTEIVIQSILTAHTAEDTAFKERYPKIYYPFNPDRLGIHYVIEDGRHFKEDNLFSTYEELKCR